MSKAVLVAGHGHAFPERTIVCTAQSRFRIQRPDIHPLIPSDVGEHVDPELVMESPLSREILPEDEEEGVNAAITEHGAVFFPASLLELLPTLEQDSFNALLFFGIPDLDEQLEEGLGTAIERVLKPNGVFAGSGNFSEGAVSLSSTLTVEREVRLPNNDRGYLYMNHLGFVARKNGVGYNAGAPPPRGAKRESTR